MNTKLVLVLILLTISLSGCSLGSEPQSQKAQDPIPADLVLAEDVKAQVLTHKAVDQATVVVIDENISLAVKISGFDRLRLKQIRREIHTKVKQIVPDTYNIHITTDKRIFRDIEAMTTQLREHEGMASPEIQDRLTKLNEDMHG